MFAYFGSKSKIAHLYPEPAFPLIIEPFAGSARYALRYADRQVWLNDYDWRIAEIWEWMRQASLADVEALPDIQPGEYLSAFKLPRPQRLLMGFAMNRGKTSGGNLYQGWAAENGEVRLLKERLRDNIERIRHWQVTNQQYQDLPDVKATWFIDPPYQVGGQEYRHHAIDYTELAAWCKSRKGQVIVCENDFADWLPFKPLVNISGRNASGTLRNIQECLWTQ